MSDLQRGNQIVQLYGVWLYLDTSQAVAKNPDRECGRCELPNTSEGYDACLRMLPGVRNACCGHGDIEQSYVQLDSGRRLGGESALRFFRIMGCGAAA